MSRRRKGQRMDTREAPREEREDTTANAGPVRSALAFYRGKDGWVLVELQLPDAVIEQHTTRRHEPDLAAMMLAKVDNAIARVIDGR